MIALGQKDKRWGSIQLGTSDKTISSHGCTVTSLAIILGTTPDLINDRLKQVEGYAQGNLVIWGKLEEAFPGIKIKRVWTYDNADVLKNVPNVLVEVDGKPIGGFRHWLVYIGNKKALDPWIGEEVSTMKYPNPLSYCVIGGKWNKPSPTTDAHTELDKVRLERDANWNMFVALCDTLQAPHNVEVAVLEIKKLIGIEDTLLDRQNKLDEATVKITDLEDKLVMLQVQNESLKADNEKLKEEVDTQFDTITKQDFNIQTFQEQIEALKTQAKLPLFLGWKKFVVSFLAKL